jgi:hypothetical protein
VPAWKNYNNYNSHHQLAKQYSEKWENGGWHNPGGYRILYYDNPNNIDDLTDSKNGLSIYPVPATAYINVALALEYPTSVSGIVFDMQGRVVKQFSAKAHGNFHKVLNIQDIPAGQYMISVQVANKASVARNFTVIR